MTDTTSYIEHACTLRLPGWEIPAALTRPAAPDDTVLASAILLVPGSLFSDVNGDYPTWNIFPHVYAHLARQLSSLGHAVYRYAKLGPGTGSTAIDEAGAIPRTWEGRLQMTIGALDGMRRELDARGVRVARLIGAGHSEGSVAISRLAVTEHGKLLSGVVLLAGPSVGIIEIMREQMGAERAAEALAAMPEEGQRYMRDIEATDPTRLAREMPQPTLIVQGGNDSSVPAHHGERLRDAAGVRGEYVFVPDVTHMFKVVPPGLAPQEAFGYPGETDARVTAAIDRWIRQMPI